MKPFDEILIQKRIQPYMVIKNSMKESSEACIQYVHNFLKENIFSYQEICVSP